MQNDFPKWTDAPLVSQAHDNIWRVRSEITESSLADCDGPKGTDWNSIEPYSSTPAGVLTEPYLCSATAGVGTLELECRPQRAKDVMKAMFVAMRFGLG